MGIENPPAFPSMKPLDHWGDPHRGMDLRDWFAGQALAGLLTGCAGMIGREFSAYAKGDCNAVIVDRAYVIADAMLTERLRTQTGVSDNG